jgi:hypothetical protein
MPFLMILTLKEHQEGIWIRRLVQSLTYQKPTIPVRVVALEDYLQPFLVSSIPAADCVGLVNRVSDAAAPHLFKACLAVLSVSSLHNIPVFNGPQAYALCANKWCQHVIFSKAKLESPPTVAFMNTEQNKSQMKRALDMLLPSDEVLIKPNAGGFGAGIVKVALNHDAVFVDTAVVPDYPDRMTLIQSYIPNAKLYRLWFLNGRIQCAVERTDNDITGGCVADTCSLVPTPVPWVVSDQVKADLEQLVACLPSDMHCGSVEFLVCDKDNKRLYFDLNLLSTLPVKEDGPWNELAQAIWEHVDNGGAVK